ncbi:MAG TPA: thioredoxin family protein [Terriglobia bacterium]|nr:thioredoxin family protein [Terriglobia bacterium]
MATSKMELPHSKVVSPAEWLAARKEHLAKEKEFTRLRDELSRERRELPWEKVEKQYVFDGPNGKETLADLFGKLHQLIVYHFMLGPGWKEGCPSCSYLADHYDGATIHLANRDVTLAVVSRATWPEIEAFKKRMGWRFNWVSSFGNDFNYDYHVSFAKDDSAQGKVFYNYAWGQFPSEEAPGASVFYKNEAGEIFHTYSTYARGLDILVGTYNFLDLVPKGRDEDGFAHTMAWVRHHDRYTEGYVVDAAQLYSPPKSTDAGCCSGKDDK